MDLHIGLSLYVRPLTDVPSEQVSVSIAETTTISDQPSTLHRAGILLARFILLQDALAVARRIGQVVSDTISLQSNWAASFRYNSAQFEGIDIGDTPVVALVVSHEEQTSVGDQVETGQLSNVQLSDGSTIQDQIQVTNRFMIQIEDGLAVQDTSLTNRFIGEIVTDHVTIQQSDAESSRRIEAISEGLTVQDTSLTNRFIGETVLEGLTVQPAQEVKASLHIDVLQGLAITPQVVVDMTSGTVFEETITDGLTIQPEAVSDPPQGVLNMIRALRGLLAGNLPRWLRRIFQRLLDRLIDQWY